MKIWKTIIQLLLPTFQLITGVLIGLFLVKLRYITVSQEITIGDIVGFLISIGIAVFISYFLNIRIDNNKTEKEIITEEICNLMGEMEILKKFIDQLFSEQKILEKKDSIFILVKTRHINKRLFALITNLGRFGNDGNIERVVQDMKKTQKRFYIELTENLIAGISPVTYSKTEKNYLDFSSNIVKLKKMINDF